ncbi:MAG: hypothetical protein ABL921_09820 [Pirellula sp.]
MNSDGEERLDRSKVADQMAATNSLLSSSICLQCADHRTIVSGKGSVFLLCQSMVTPAQWPKYPPQPLRQCDYLRVKSE